jgi:hypothetical protein
MQINVAIILLLDIFTKSKVIFMMKILALPNKLIVDDGRKFLLTASSNDNELYGGVRAGESLPDGSFADCSYGVRLQFPDNSVTVHGNRFLFTEIQKSLTFIGILHHLK